MPGDVRELIRAAQAAEVGGDVAAAIELLDKAAALYRESGNQVRAEQMRRHAQRLSSGGAPFRSTEVESPQPGRDPLETYQLGRVEYSDGLTMQELFAAARAAETVPDTLLLLEHSPVLTLGRAAKREHVLAPAERLAELGVELFETDRGGDVTYHGPGQLVGYPILKLPGERQDVRRYMRDLEEVLIRALARFDIEAMRESRWPGVWVRLAGRLAKIAAVGVHLARWVTRHGFALNVNTDMAHYRLIVPCGIRDAGVTSMERILGAKVELREVERAVAEEFAAVFGASLKPARQLAQTVCVALVRRREGVDEVLLARRTHAKGGFWQLVTGHVEAGETLASAAARELLEETGQSVAVRDLSYRHAFALAGSSPPRLIEESAFAAVWNGAEIRLDPAEHDAFEWVDAGAARQRLPFEGLRKAVSRGLLARRQGTQLTP